MARFDILTSEEMSDQQRALTEENQAAGGRLRGGPYWAYLSDPELMRRQMALNEHVRDSSLDKRAPDCDPDHGAVLEFGISLGRPGALVARTRH